MSNIGKVPQPGKDLVVWARETARYLNDLARPRDLTQIGTPVLLSHRSRGTAERATTEGILLYDPLGKSPVCSVEGEWRPIAVGQSLAVEYSTAYNVAGTGISDAGTAVPFSALTGDSDLVSFSTPYFTLQPGRYEVEGYVTIQSETGASRTVVVYVAASSDITTPISTVSQAPAVFQTLNSQVNVFISGTIDVAAATAYGVICKADATGLRMGPSHNISGFENSHARFKIKLVGLNE